MASPSSFCTFASAPAYPMLLSSCRCCVKRVTVSKVTAFINPDPTAVPRAQCRDAREKQHGGHQEWVGGRHQRREDSSGAAWRVCRPHDEQIWPGPSAPLHVLQAEEYTRLGATIDPPVSNLAAVAEWHSGRVAGLHAKASCMQKVKGIHGHDRAPCSKCCMLPAQLVSAARRASTRPHAPICAAPGVAPAPARSTGPSQPPPNSLSLPFPSFQLDVDGILWAHGPCAALWGRHPLAHP